VTHHQANTQAKGGQDQKYNCCLHRFERLPDFLRLGKSGNGSC
jgi:hypothetical protein